MDRRQKKTREAIFNAFIMLLSGKDFDHITVGEIIETADIGRATFYAHFPTKDFLLKELCEELFCHIFDAMNNESNHKHIFECNAPDSVFLHLIEHLKNDDNNILTLLSSQNNELFFRYFRNNLVKLVENQLPLFNTGKKRGVPESFLINHITSSFIETIRWWIDNGKKETPEKLTQYFFAVV